MTDRAEIERLLNQTGRTLEGATKVEIGYGSRRNGKTMIIIKHLSDMIELLVGALRDALDKQPKWISVKERLPDTHGIYLAHVVHRYCKVDSYSRVCIEYFSKDCDWDSLADLYEVTHWMQLPKSPEEEG